MKSTETARPLTALSVTVNVAATVLPASPSVTVTSSIASEGSGSLSLIVPGRWPSAMVALVAVARLTVKVSLASSSGSPLTRT